MSGPMKSGEPSMEEILASIRKIISDDPAKAPAGEAGGLAATAAPTLGAPAPKLGSSAPTLGASGRTTAPGSSRNEPGFLSAPSSASPLPGAGVPPAGAGDNSASARQAPSFGRLSEALRTSLQGSEAAKPSGSFASMRFGQSAPSSPLSDAGRSLEPSLPEPVFGVSDERSRSIASEMDDILDEPLPDDSQAQPAPAAPAAGKWAVWRTPSGKPGEKNEPSLGFTPPPAAGGNASAGGPQPNSPGARAASPAPSMAFGRSSGFYPANAPAPSLDSSNRFEPQLPASGATPAPQAFGSVVPDRNVFASDSNGPASPAYTPASPAQGSASPSHGMASPSHGSASPSHGSASPANTSAPPAYAPAPRFDPLAKADTTATPPASREPMPGSKPAPVVIASMPAAPVPPPAAPKIQAPQGTVAVEALAASGLAPAAPAGPTGPSVPLPPRSTIFSRPLVTPKSIEDAPPAASSSVVLPPARSGGLAFSAPKPSAPVEAPLPVTRPAAAAPPAPLAAASQALDALAAGFAAANATSPASAAGPSAAQAATARSLEDMVTEMVKPMLQRWIDDNMPRIIEKALRSETQAGSQKPPGT